MHLEIEGAGFNKNPQFNISPDKSMKTAEPINRFLTRIPKERFEPAMGEATVCGLALDIDDASGHCRKAGPIRVGGVLNPTSPDFWDAA